MLYLTYICWPALVGDKRMRAYAKINIPEFIQALEEKIAPNIPRRLDHLILCITTACCVLPRYAIALCFMVQQSYM